MPIVREWPRRKLSTQRGAVRWQSLCAAGAMHALLGAMALVDLGDHPGAAPPPPVLELKIEAPAVTTPAALELDPVPQAEASTAEPPPAPVGTTTEAAPAEFMVPTPLPQVEAFQAEPPAPPEPQRVEPEPPATPPHPSAAVTPIAPPAARPSRPQARPVPARAPLPPRSTAAPAVSAPAAPVEAPTSSDLAGAEQAWRRAVAAWIERRRVYPDAARRQGEQGQVLVRVTLDAAGHVTQATVVRGSGAASLDAAALDMLRGAVMPPPPDAGSEPRGMTVSLRYRLE